MRQKEGVVHVIFLRIQSSSLLLKFILDNRVVACCVQIDYEHDGVHTALRVVDILCRGKFCQ